jgi:hypothetical protein
LVTSRPVTNEEWATLRTVIDAMETSFVDAEPSPTGPTKPSFQGHGGSEDDEDE